MKAIIIDDEQYCITALQNDLEMFCPDVQVADTCTSAKEGMLSIKRNSPDLIFLDVEMPWMNGFEMLEILDKEITFSIVFTTAYDQFAAKAFRVSAVDYLLKPIDGADLVAAVAKATNKGNGNNIGNLLQNAKLPGEHQKIAVPTRDGYDFIPVAEMIYCKAAGAYTDVVMADHKKLMLSKSLGEMEELLPTGLFERIHHSALVNMQHINQFKKANGLSIVMNNGDELTVSKSKKEHLLARLGIK